MQNFFWFCVTLFNFYKLDEDDFSGTWGDSFWSKIYVAGSPLFLLVSVRLRYIPARMSRIAVTGDVATTNSAISTSCNISR